MEYFIKNGDPELEKDIKYISKQIISDIIDSVDLDMTGDRIVHLSKQTNMNENDLITHISRVVLKEACRKFLSDAWKDNCNKQYEDIK